MSSRHHRLFDQPEVPTFLFWMNSHLAWAERTNKSHDLELIDGAVLELSYQQPQRSQKKMNARVFGAAFFSAFKPFFYWKKIAWEKSRSQLCSVFPLPGILLLRSNGQNLASTPCKSISFALPLWGRVGNTPWVSLRGCCWWLCLCCCLCSCWLCSWLGFGLGHRSSGSRLGSRCFGNHSPARTTK